MFVFDNKAVNWDFARRLLSVKKCNHNTVKSRLLRKI